MQAVQQKSKTFKLSIAGRRYMALLAAFNTGDPAQMRAFVEREFDPFSFTDDFVDEFMAWYHETYTQTGGMSIFRTYLAQEDYVILLVKGNGDGQLYLDKLKVTPESPYLVTEYFHEIKND